MSDVKTVQTSKCRRLCARAHPCAVTYAPRAPTFQVVPGSGIVKEQAEAEGLDKILVEAGFDWREPGCSMCLAMNPDKLLPQERCASTSNRNFEGRQGTGGRTHLLSPAMAAAAAITGNLADIRKVGMGDTGVSSTDSKDYLSGDFVIAPMPKKGKGVAVAGAGGMPKFTVLKGKAAALNLQNVDTDMIIPANFLKTIKRTGLGVSAFYAMRYNEDGSEKPDFVLNKDAYRQSSILVTGANFGCGSSREHAPWAINDFGIRCIISTSFADIFFNNCLKNGMLPIKLPEAQVLELMTDCEERPPPSKRSITRRDSKLKTPADPTPLNPTRNHEPNSKYHLRMITQWSLRASLSINPPQLSTLSLPSSITHPQP